MISLTDRAAASRSRRAIGAAPAPARPRASTAACRAGAPQPARGARRHRGADRDPLGRDADAAGDRSSSASWTATASRAGERARRRGRRPSSPRPSVASAPPPDRRPVQADRRRRAARRPCAPSSCAAGARALAPYDDGLGDQPVARELLAGLREARGRRGGRMWSDSLQVVVGQLGRRAAHEREQLLERGVEAVLVAGVDRGDDRVVELVELVVVGVVEARTGPRRRSGRSLRLSPALDLLRAAARARAELGLHLGQLVVDDGRRRQLLELAVDVVVARAELREVVERAGGLELLRPRRRAPSCSRSCRPRAASRGRRRPSARPRRWRPRRSGPAPRRRCTGP